jgi:hypothetical protein
LLTYVINLYIFSDTSPSTHSLACAKILADISISYCLCTFDYKNYLY